MGTELVKFIENTSAIGPAEGLISLAIRGCLSTKTIYRGAKAYRRYLSHGIKDTQFLMNATSSICAGGSLLTLGSAKIISLTSLSPLSATLMNVSTSLSTMSDTLDGSYTLGSVII